MLRGSLCVHRVPQSSLYKLASHNVHSRPENCQIEMGVASPSDMTGPDLRMLTACQQVVLEEHPGGKA